MKDAMGGKKQQSLYKGLMGISTGHVLREVQYLLA